MDQSKLPARPIERIYAIGDIHGRYDLFRRLINIVERDHTSRPQVSAQIVVLGNFIDYGPQVAHLVRGLIDLTAHTRRLKILKGNHEDMMVEALRGNLAVYSNWLEFGGRATLSSWGASQQVVEGTATRENMLIAANTVGNDVIDWLAELPLFHRVKDFFFVHAGIRPGIDIYEQDPEDLLWITKEFTESNVAHGVIVVHGHSMSEKGPEVRFNRIGIDTGAYRTSQLTALGIEGGDTWILTTKQGEPSTDEGPRVSSYPYVAPPGVMHHAGSYGRSGSLRGPAAFDDEQLDSDLSSIFGLQARLLPAVQFAGQRVAIYRRVQAKRPIRAIGLTLLFGITAGSAALLVRNQMPTQGNTAHIYPANLPQSITQTSHKVFKVNPASALVNNFDSTSIFEVEHIDKGAVKGLVQNYHILPNNKPNKPSSLHRIASAPPLRMPPEVLVAEDKDGVRSAISTPPSDNSIGSKEELSRTGPYSADAPDSQRIMVDKASRRDVVNGIRDFRRQ